jgi:hypothetical protein
VTVNRRIDDNLIGHELLPRHGGAVDLPAANLRRVLESAKRDADLSRGIGGEREDR